MKKAAFRDVTRFSIDDLLYKPSLFSEQGQLFAIFIEFLSHTSPSTITTIHRLSSVPRANREIYQQKDAEDPPQLAQSPKVRHVQSTILPFVHVGDVPTKIRLQ